jgi:hypothetical protein
MIIPTKFGPLDSEKKIKIYKLTDDDGRQVITIPQMTLWVR